MNTEGSPRFFRVKAVAELLDVSPSTIYRAIDAGDLEAVRIGGTVRVPAHAVAAFANQPTSDLTTENVSALTKGGC